jgi:hypothetical protein
MCDWCISKRIRRRVTADGVAMAHSSTKRPPSGRQYDEAANHLRALQAGSRFARTPAPVTFAWPESVDNVLHELIAGEGLCDPRKNAWAAEVTMSRSTSSDGRTSGKGPG